MIEVQMEVTFDSITTAMDSWKQDLSVTPIFYLSDDVVDQTNELTQLLENVTDKRLLKRLFFHFLHDTFHHRHRCIMVLDHWMKIEIDKSNLPLDLQLSDDLHMRMHALIESEELSLVQALLDRGYPIDDRYFDRSLLHTAALTSKKAVELLFNYQPTFLPDGLGFTPAQYACRNEYAVPILRVFHRFNIDLHHCIDFVLMKSRSSYDTYGKKKKRHSIDYDDSNVLDYLSTVCEFSDEQKQWISEHN